MPSRARPRVVVRDRTANCSKRLVSRPSIIVVHSTQSPNVTGDTDLKNLGAWFSNPSAGVSCHVATDGDGHSAVYVNSLLKAWHVGSYNSAAVGVEQIGYAAQRSWSEAQIKETARWIARWSKMYGIPIRHGIPGVVTHSQLGQSGGGHSDPGPAYPMKAVLRHARVYRRRMARR